MLIFEKSKTYSIKFFYNENYFEFPGNTLKECVGPIIDWLYKSGYKFSVDLVSQTISEKYK
jgi:hypothetical protein